MHLGILNYSVSVCDVTSPLSILLYVQVLFAFVCGASCFFFFQPRIFIFMPTVGLCVLCQFITKPFLNCNNVVKLKQKKS